MGENSKIKLYLVVAARLAIAVDELLMVWTAAVSFEGLQVVEVSTSRDAALAEAFQRAAWLLRERERDRVRSER